MKKVLFISNVLSHIEVFHLPYLKYFSQKGYEVHILTNAGDKKADYCDKLYNINISRSPFSLKNISALRRAKKIIDFEKYDIIHCHTPMGGVIGRLAASNLRKKGAKIIYTAHGFHFYKGAPLLNWLIYFPAEKYLAKKTDCIITINKEDFNLANKHFKSAKTEVFQINGIGVNTEKFSNVNTEQKIKLKEDNGYKDKFLLIYTAEFIKRKNHRFFIENSKQLFEKCPQVKFLFAGKGKLFEEMKQLAKETGVSEYFEFLGFRQDINELLKICDVVVSASIEEGFGINIVEGLATGLPAVASIVRGHKEMVTDGFNGYLFDAEKPETFCNSIEKLYNNKNLYKKLSENAYVSAKEFSLENSLKQMETIYRSIEHKK